MSAFADELDLIIRVHNRIRTELYPHPSPEAHLVNENTVLRLQALLEAYDLDAPKTGMATGATDGEIAVRALKYLRNLMPHKDHGVFRVRKCSVHWDAFRQFAARYADARVPEGQPICLDAEKVLQPLADGLVQWAVQRGVV